MANGGGPACLRLRVVADPARVDPRFLADEATLDRIAAVVAAHWPEAIVPDDLASAAHAADVTCALRALLEALGQEALGPAVLGRECISPVRRLDRRSVG